MKPPSDADCLRLPELVCEPDRRALDFVCVDLQTGTCRDRWALERARARHSFEQIQKMSDAKLETMVVDESCVQASEQDLGHDWLGAFLEYLPKIRNDYAHGSFTLHPNVLRTFEVVMEINHQPALPRQSKPV